MPGCSDIIKKLRKFPAQQAAENLIVDTTINAALGCWASVTGAEILGLDTTTAARNGALGVGVFGAARSLASSVCDYINKPDEEEKKEEKKQEQKSFGNRASSYVHNTFSIPKATEQKPEQKEAAPTDYAPIITAVFVLITKYMFYGTFGTMMGDMMLNMPAKIEDAAESAAIGSAILIAMPFVLLAVGKCAYHCVDKCIDAEDAICCDAENPEESQRIARPGR